MGRILVADDDVNIQAVLRYCLEASGHAVLTASDGAETLEVINAETPDAVVLDLMMPVIDGIEVLEALSTEGTLDQIPLLILTARVDKKDEVRVFGKTVVEKPFSPRDVARQIEDMLVPASA